MKKLLYILLFVSIALYGQENDPCYSVNDYNLLLEPNNLITKDFSAGWNMFGYPCFESIDVIEAFSSIVDKIIIVKDNNGAAYITEWDFNGIGLLQGGDGYQIKMSDTEYGFSFCDGINLPNIEGCTDCEAANFNKFAITDDGSCSYESELIYGCIYLWADNYDPTATENDESCYRFGCLETWADNFDPLATINSGDCNKLGCTSEWADNYDSFATINDESCTLSACNLEWADNYDYHATTDDGSCYKYGCSDSLADNFDPMVTINDGSCNFSLIGHSIYLIFEEEGNPFFEEFFISFINESTIIIAERWNNSDNILMYDGDVTYEIIDSDTLFNPWTIFLTEYDTAINYIYSFDWNIYINEDYESGYLIEEGQDTLPFFSIEEIIYGCIDPAAINFNPDANTNSGDCIPIEYGCTDELACNYSLTANSDNGSCLFPGELEFFEELSTNFSQGTDMFSQGTSLFLQGTNLFIQGTNLFINSSTSIVESIINQIYDLFESFDSQEIFDCDGCLNDLNNNEICDELEIYGCIDINACNFDVNANTDDGSCYNNDLGCGCNTPPANPGYDCNGNIDLDNYNVDQLYELGVSFNDIIQNEITPTSITITSTYLSGCSTDGGAADNCWDPYLVIYGVNGLIIETNYIDGDCVEGASFNQNWNLSSSLFSNITIYVYDYESMVLVPDDLRDSVTLNFWDEVLNYASLNNLNNLSESPNYIEIDDNDGTECPTLEFYFTINW